MSILFEKTRINNLTLSNRFIRSATWAGMAGEDGGVTPKLLKLMGDLADGGVGLIITGHAYVHPNGIHSAGQLGIDRDLLIPGLEQMTRLVHAKGKILGRGLSIPQDGRDRRKIFRAVETLISGDVEKENTNK